MRFGPMATLSNRMGVLFEAFAAAISATLRTYFGPVPNSCCLGRILFGPARTACSGRNKPDRALIDLRPWPVIRLQAPSLPPGQTHQQSFFDPQMAYVGPRSQRPTTMRAALRSSTSRLDTGAHRPAALCPSLLASRAPHLPCLQRCSRRNLAQPCNSKRTMSLADACLVRMTEVQTRAKVITLDSDFQVYRRNGRQIIPTISPK